jgi:hypothetical protein
MTQANNNLIVSNRMLHYFENEKYDITRRNVIVAIVNEFLSSEGYLKIVQVAIKNNTSNDISLAKIPGIIKLIINCLNTMNMNKNMISSDLKFYIYGILISYIVVEDPVFFADIDANLFETLYDGLYDLIKLSPKLVEVAKTTFTICC